MKSLGFLCLLLSTNVFGLIALPSERLNQLSGEVPGPSDPKARWDKQYSANTYVYGKEPAEFLAKNFDYFPARSNILDVGMGEGRNAVFLAKKGHKVTGIDISSVAVMKAQNLAKETGVRIKSVTDSIKKHEFPARSFDAIICFYYVDRSILIKFFRWLKPGGVLIYEAHTNDHPKLQTGELTSQDVVSSQELLSWFQGTKILKYEEPIAKNRASIIVQKI